MYRRTPVQNRTFISPFLFGNQSSGGEPNDRRGFCYAVGPFPETEEAVREFNERRDYVGAGRSIPFEQFPSENTGDNSFKFLIFTNLSREESRRLQSLIGTPFAGGSFLASEIHYPTFQTIVELVTKLFSEEGNVIYENTLDLSDLKSRTDIEIPTRRKWKFINSDENSDTNIPFILFLCALKADCMGARIEYICFDENPISLGIGFNNVKKLFKDLKKISFYKCFDPLHRVSINVPRDVEISRERFRVPLPVKPSPKVKETVQVEEIVSKPVDEDFMRSQVSRDRKLFDEAAECKLQTSPIRTFVEAFLKECTVNIDNMRHMYGTEENPVQFSVRVDTCGRNSPLCLYKSRIDMTEFPVFGVNSIITKQLHLFPSGQFECKATKMETGIMSDTENTLCIHGVFLDEYGGVLGFDRSLFIRTDEKGTYIMADHLFLRRCASADFAESMSRSFAL